MLRFPRISAALTGALFALGAPTVAQPKLWIVSGSGCPLVHFDQIQPAVDAAADGDVILVRKRASSYDADLTVSQVTRETILEGVIGTQLAAEQPGLVESATLEQEQGAEHTRGAKQAITWSHDRSAQAVVETRGGNEVVVSTCGLMYRGSFSTNNLANGATLTCTGVKETPIRASTFFLVE